MSRVTTGTFVAPGAVAAAVDGHGRGRSLGPGSGFRTRPSGAH